MNSPEWHYQEAENMLELAEDHTSDNSMYRTLILEAQVHATLALFRPVAQTWDLP